MKVFTDTYGDRAVSDQALWESAFVLRPASREESMWRLPIWMPWDWAQ